MAPPGLQYKIIRRPTLAVFSFSIVAPSCLHFQLGPPENKILKKKRQPKQVAFYCRPQPLAFSVRPARKCNRLGVTIEKEKTAKAGSLLFFYSRPQPLVFSGGTIGKCKRLGVRIKKKRQPKQVYFYFYIVALSCLHSCAVAHRAPEM